MSPFGVWCTAIPFDRRLIISFGGPFCLFVFVPACLPACLVFTTATGALLALAFNFLAFRRPGGWLWYLAV
jgi:hypothetical protein